MRAVVVSVVVVGFMMTGCTSKQQRAVSEAAVRNVVAVAGAKEFSDHGFPIHDHLTCTAQASHQNPLRVAVACHGTTTKGQIVALTGTTLSDRGDRGTFVGTVDGRQVFQKTCLGC